MNGKGDKMKVINVYPTSSVDTMAAVVAKELKEQGSVELVSQGGDAVGRVFSTVGIVKDCMDNYGVDIVSARVSENKGSFVVKATKTNRF